MINLMDYAHFASAVYEVNNTAQDQRTAAGMLAKLQEFGLTRFSLREWRAGGFINGFQGAVLESDDEVVCVFKGSAFGRTFVSDWVVNDVQITTNAIPSQAPAAFEMVAAAQRIATAGNKPVSLVGHSLGGGLAQYVGFYGVPFVTFNAPGMVGNLPLLDQIRPPAAVRGFNMILATDPVGQLGRHIGATERFRTPGMLNPFGGGAPIAHMMGSVILALENNTTWAQKLLANLVGAGTWF
jgi:hypothetical protein